MRNVGLFLVVSSVAGIALAVGCGGSSASGSGSGNGGATAASTSRTSTGTTSSHGVTTAVTTGVGGGAGGGAGGSAAIDNMCNPVTNAGCMSGDGCDIATDANGNLDGFSCYMGPNTVAPCGSCDPSGQNSPFCEPGSTCFEIDSAGDGQCARYCCADSDCGTGNVCAMSDSNGALFAPVSTVLGVCIPDPGGADAGAYDAGGGADAGTGTGGSGAGGGGAASQFACNVPTTAPSMGSCITLTPQ